MDEPHDQAPASGSATIPCLFASESGTAAGLAERVAVLARRRCLSLAVGGFDEVLASADPVVHLRTLCHASPGGVAVLLVSTTGDGEMPSNSRRFWQSCLRRRLPPDALFGVRFALFGLGDSGYGHKFCAAARKLDARLQQLGAQPAITRILADEQDPMGGVMAPFGPFCDALWAEMLHHCPLSPGFVVDDTPQLPQPSINVTLRVRQLPTVPVPVHAGTAVASAAAAAAAPTAAPWTAHLYDKAFSLLGLSTAPTLVRVGTNQRLTSPEWTQDVRSIRVQLPATQGSLTWNAGDVAWVLPENDPVAVQAMLDRCGLKRSDVVILSPSESAAVGSAAMPGAHGSGDVTAHELFSRVLALHAIPRAFALETVALLAESEEERDKLFEMASAEGADLYHDYCYRERRGWWEVLTEFESINLLSSPQATPNAKGGHDVPMPKIALLLELLPRLQPRAFSIASAPSTGTVELCVAIVEYKTPYRRARRGVCSTWLAGRSTGDAVPLWVRRGTFPELPPTTPVVMVGPGTGVAPFRAMLQQRQWQRQSTHSARHTTAPATTVTPMIPSGAAALPPPAPSVRDMLFFGCRHAASDFLYGAEFSGMARREELSFHPAFSRDQPHKVYVTHLLEAAGREVWELLALCDGAVFVAGSAGRMPRDVNQALREIVMRHGEMDSKAADTFLRQLERRRRYCVEAYG